MKTLRGPELDVLLKIDDALVGQLQIMSVQGRTLDELIQFLADRGTPKAGTTIALRRAHIANGNDIKNAVHFHAAYAYRREADEVFYEAAAQFAEPDSREATAA